MTEHVNAMKDLYTTLIDSRDGYRDFGERADESTVKATLVEFERERALFADEVHSALMGHDVTMDDDGSLLAAAHRQFAGLRDMVGSGDEAVLAEAARGEKHLLGKYDKAIEATDAGPDMPMLAKQKDAVAAAVARLERRAETA